MIRNISTDRDIKYVIDNNKCVKQLYSAFTFS